MKLINFSFRREPVWMLVLSFLVPVVGSVLVVMVLLILRLLR